MVYLAVDYGCYEGWRLKEFSDAEAALAEVKSGAYSGCSGWKILEEIDAYAELKLKTDELREIKEYIRGFFIGIDQRIAAIEGNLGKR